MARTEFFSLPNEIKYKIYAHVFHRFELHISSEGLIYGPTYTSSTPRQAICRTNKLIKSESILILAQQTRVLRSFSEDIVDPGHQRGPGTALSNLKACFADNIRNLKAVLHRGSTIFREDPQDFMVTDEEFIDVFSAKQEGTHGDNTFEDLYDWYETKPSNIELWLHDEQKCYGSIGQPTVQELDPELWEPYGGLGAVAAYFYEESLPRRWERSELMGAWINPDLEKVEHKVHLRLQVREREVPDKAIVTNANEEEWWYDY